MELFLEAFWIDGKKFNLSFQIYIIIYLQKQRFLILFVYGIMLIYLVDYTLPILFFNAERSKCKCIV